MREAERTQRKWGFISCDWEIRESLLEEATARTNAPRWELQGAREAVHTRVEFRVQRPEVAGGEMPGAAPAPAGHAKGQSGIWQGEDT